MQASPDCRLFVAIAKDTWQKENGSKMFNVKYLSLRDVQTALLNKQLSQQVNTIGMCRFKLGNFSDVKIVIRHRNE